MLIYYAVEGGIANQLRSLAIARDGSATVSVSGRTSTKTLAPGTVEALVAELSGSGLFGRDRTYPAHGADLQRYEIRFGGATLVGYDTSIPDRLTRAVADLERALRS